MATRTLTPHLLPLAAVLLAACSAATSAPAVADGQPGGQTVQVAVAPVDAASAPGGAVQFTATVTGAADTGVDWAVVEAGGGNVDATGRYVAPAGAGTYHVRATSRADATRAAVAAVSVTATPPVTVTIAPRAVTLAAGASQAFSAAVANAADGAVTWSVQESACGTVTPAGVYTAPQGGATCHVVARSVADPARTDLATVTVTPAPPVVVAVSPSSGAVGGCETLQLAATVTGTSDTRVTWSVQEGAAGGTVSGTGRYTAPSQRGSYHVTATSVAAPGSAAAAVITVSEHVLRVEVSPAVVTIPAGGTAQLTATVTTSCGAYTTTQLVAAPN